MAAPPGIAGDVRQDRQTLYAWKHPSNETCQGNRANFFLSGDHCELGAWQQGALTKMRVFEQLGRRRWSEQQRSLAKNSGTECRCLVPGKRRLHVLCSFLPERGAGAAWWWCARDWLLRDGRDGGMVLTMPSEPSLTVCHLPLPIVHRGYLTCRTSRESCCLKDVCALVSAAAAWAIIATGARGGGCLSRLRLWGLGWSFVDVLLDRISASTDLDDPFRKLPGLFISVRGLTAS
ncbi:hypothetical protein QBC41DRAFT_156467 [Cercophora samala]|uniref:Uncharacterized protein n=1 Tax=Cercophora samala TaxID=330535 RepID=A0AA40D7S6_9PEZI|nr:hypothetical protein QBC41DRAFT_156467 [Cercophora samala]